VLFPRSTSRPKSVTQRCGRAGDSSAKARSERGRGRPHPIRAARTSMTPERWAEVNDVLQPWVVVRGAVVVTGVTGVTGVVGAPKIHRTSESSAKTTPPKFAAPSRTRRVSTSRLLDLLHIRGVNRTCPPMINSRRNRRSGQSSSASIGIP
jgi:hypothetical protein